VFSRIASAGPTGRLKYESPCLARRTRSDGISEARAVAGLGLGGRERFAFALTSDWAIAILQRFQRLQLQRRSAYRRFSNYLYAPAGLTMRIHLGSRWVLAPTVEADVLLQGRQVSKLSDTGLGYIDVTNEQKKGASRASLMLEKDHWAIGRVDALLAHQGFRHAIRRRRKTACLAGALEPEN